MAQPAAGGWRAAPSAVDVLLGCGWLDEDDARDPRLRIDTTSSSHELSRVMVPGRRGVVVKRVPRQAAARHRNLAREMFVYRLARWMPDIADAVPHPVFIDEGRHVVVVEALATGPQWPDPAQRAPLDADWIGQRLGTVLAGVHRATAGMAMWPSPSVGILALPEALDEARAGRPAQTGALLDMIAGDADFRAALGAGRAAYSLRCVIHGDLRSDNWLAGDRPGARALKLLDWELAGSGDPAWDVGCLLAEAVLEQLREHLSQHLSQPLNEPPGEHRGASATGPAGPFPDALAAPCGAVLRSYFDTPGVLPPDGDTWEKLVLYAHARLLHVACECCDAGSEPDGWPVVALLGTARALVRDTGAAARQVRTWGGA